MLFEAVCICYACKSLWNQEYRHEDEVYCPECYSDNVEFDQVREIGYDHSSDT